jgi:hypothetical protein
MSSPLPLLIMLALTLTISNRPLVTGQLARAASTRQSVETPAQLPEQVR